MVFPLSYAIFKGPPVSDIPVAGVGLHPPGQGSRPGGDKGIPHRALQGVGHPLRTDAEVHDE